MPGRHRRGRRQPGHLQAAAAGRGDRRHARSTRAGSAASTRCSPSPADGGQVRRAGLPARRRGRPVRVRPAPGDLRLPAGGHARWTAGWSSTSTTCTSTSSTRCAPAAAATCCPTQPGYSATMKPESIAEFSLPGRPGMAVTGGAAGSAGPRCAGCRPRPGRWSGPGDVPGRHRPPRTRRVPPGPPGRLHRGRRSPRPAATGASSAVAPRSPDVVDALRRAGPPVQRDQPRRRRRRAPGWSARSPACAHARQRPGGGGRRCWPTRRSGWSR